MNTQIVVAGAAGRMGKRIIANSFSEGLDLVGAVESTASPAIGRDAFHVAGAEGSFPQKILIGDSLEAIFQSGKGDVLIDFSHADATVPNLEVCARFQKAAVIGSTGHGPEQRESIARLASRVPIVMSSNMSVGVNVFWRVIADTARLLGPDFDVEVLEAHHRLKKDAPSGTAMTTAQVLAQALNRDLSKDAVYHREGLIGERKPEEIGIQTIRGGDVVGDHTVFFLGNGERLEVTHRATSRDVFALGALRAARWVVGKPAGLYSMRDVLDRENPGRP